VDDLRMHCPRYCPHCHTDLPADLPPVAPAERRQIVDLPPVRAYMTE
jgi:hypothetical protein